MQFTEEELENEEWLDVVNYEGLYQVSNLGRILRNGFEYYSPYSGKIIEKPRFVEGANKNGYRQIKLFKDGVGKFFMIHQLEMKAFKENPENKPFVNHKNSKRGDNRLTNLEWCTPKENIVHAHTTNKEKRRFYMPRGAERKFSKLDQEKVDFIRANIGILTQDEMALKFGVGQSTIHKVISGKTWNYKD